METENNSNVGYVKLERFGSVSQLTLSRTKSLNSLTWEMYKQLEEHLENISNDPSVRVLIIRGDGDKAFAAGTDIHQFKNFTGNDGINYENKIDKIVDKLEKINKPTIAAINGYAVGGGMILATACDLRYATPKSKFGAPMAKTLGNCLSLNNYQRLASELNNMYTKELLYTARMMDAKEAISKGFLTDVFEEEGFYNNVIKIATKISENAPLTIKATKLAFNKLNSGEKILDSIYEFDNIIHEVYESKDFAEGVNSHIEKRHPLWQGE
ncbi:enoyl-CoA hydratase [Oceanobacillus timonensis]|uniref:enoyl-CoA hydratase n=1 Tax=Oceanobacillus timonensis TaxID=1926285 RepID=UPI0009BBC480|nr:enoyl-CoA hydratase [Oceanobacillus timonensis]